LVLLWWDLLSRLCGEMDQGAACSVPHLYFCETYKNKKETTDCNIRGATCTNSKQDPTKNSGEKWLPKYDPQSETTINSCLWLGTILGQHRNKTPR
jgi:hypothetical protein